MNDTIPTIHHLAALQCPYCWQSIELAIDVAFAQQDMIEDCPLCCRPITLKISMDQDGYISADASSDDF